MATITRNNTRSFGDEGVRVVQHTIIIASPSSVFQLAFAHGAVSVSVRLSGEQSCGQQNERPLNNSIKIGPMTADRYTGGLVKQPPAANGTTATAAAMTTTTTMTFVFNNNAFAIIAAALVSSIRNISMSLWCALFVWHIQTHTPPDKTANQPQRRNAPADFRLRNIRHHSPSSVQTPTSFSYSCILNDALIVRWYSGKLHSCSGTMCAYFNSFAYNIIIPPSGGDMQTRSPSGCVRNVIQFPR